MDKQALLQQLENDITNRDAESAVDTAQAIVDGGLDVMEAIGLGHYHSAIHLNRLTRDVARVFGG